MKKAFIAIVLITLFSFKANEEKKLKVELTIGQWQYIMSQLDNSASPHNEVKVTTGWIIEQLKPQIDTTKH